MDEQGSIRTKAFNQKSGTLLDPLAVPAGSRQESVRSLHSPSRLTKRSKADVEPSLVSIAEREETSYVENSLGYRMFKRQPTKSRDIKPKMWLLKPGDRNSLIHMLNDITDRNSKFLFYEMRDSASDQFKTQAGDVGLLMKRRKSLKDNKAPMLVRENDLSDEEEGLIDNERPKSIDIEDIYNRFAAMREQWGKDGFGRSASAIKINLFGNSSPKQGMSKSRRNSKLENSSVEKKSKYLSSGSKLNDSGRNSLKQRVTANLKRNSLMKVLGPGGRSNPFTNTNTSYLGATSILSQSKEYTPQKSNSQLKNLFSGIFTKSKPKKTNKGSFGLINEGLENRRTGTATNLHNSKNIIFENSEAQVSGASDEENHDKKASEENLYKINILNNKGSFGPSDPERMIEDNPVLHASSFGGALIKESRSHASAKQGNSVYATAQVKSVSNLDLITQPQSKFFRLRSKSNHQVIDQNPEDENFTSIPPMRQLNRVQPAFNMMVTPEQSGELRSQLSHTNPPLILIRDAGDLFTPEPVLSSGGTHNIHNSPDTPHLNTYQSPQTNTDGARRVNSSLFMRQSHLSSSSNHNRVIEIKPRNATNTPTKSKSKLDPFRRYKVMNSKVKFRKSIDKNTIDDVDNKKNENDIGTKMLFEGHDKEDSVFWDAGISTLHREKTNFNVAESQFESAMSSPKFDTNRNSVSKKSKLRSTKYVKQNSQTDMQPVLRNTDKNIEQGAQQKMLDEFQDPRRKYFFPKTASLLEKKGKHVSNEEALKRDTELYYQDISKFGKELKNKSISSILLHKTSAVNSRDPSTDKN